MEVEKQRSISLVYRCTIVTNVDTNHSRKNKSADKTRIPFIQENDGTLNG